MSVYTQVTQAELEAFLAPLNVGGLVLYQGIEAGVVNSNYFVDTEKGAYVLTLFENLGRDELPFFNELNEHFASRGLPCAHPVCGEDGETVFVLNGRPASLFTRLPGRHVESATAAHCGAIGEALGQLHDHVQDFPLHRDADRGWSWFEAVADQVMPRLNPDEVELLRSEMDWHRQHGLENLPSGVIHGDLFRDNVLFQSGQVSGIIDFYFASDGPFVYDLAITMNDWCSQIDGSLDEERAEALLQSYSRQRSLSQEETDHLPTALRLAALRFWLSRLQESLFPAEGEMVLIKDPAEFLRILIHRRGLKPMTADGIVGD